MHVGIDLGTTTTSVAFLDGDTPRIIPNRFGASSTPSVVAFHEERGLLVGAEALKCRVMNHGRTISGIKRRMGSSFPSSLGTKVLTPPEVSSLILKQVLQDAALYLGQPVTGAVIAVPAHFSEPQRRATMEAGARAGLKKVSLINEPTAAAVAYGGEISGKTAVFDFGGGTLDISFLEIGRGEARVRCVGGDGSLGGSDFTRCMYLLLKERFGLRDKEDGTLLGAQLFELAESAKKSLSSSSEVSVELLGRCVSIARGEYEETIAPLILRAGTVFMETFERAGWEPSVTEALIFAGGSSRIPAVRRSVEMLIPSSCPKRSSPEEIVALGAARSALSSGKGGTSFVEIIPYDLGIEIDGERTLRLIDRNTPLPCRVGHVFTTLADNQTSVEIHVLQGGYLKAGRNQSLGRFMLSPIRPAARGVPRIEVDFSLDSDGLLSVSVTEKLSGLSEKILIPRVAEPVRERGGTDLHLARLLREVESAARRNDRFIDKDLRDDIDDIMKIAREAGAGSAGSRKLDCIIALETIVSEIRALSVDGEAYRAG
jgi:molecular chaperone DnaK